MSSVELTILMPCLNEAQTLSQCIRKAKSFFERSNIQGEVLVADNGSTDGSQEIARREGARVVSVEKKGYGSALKAGVAAAQGSFVIMGDADDSYDFSELKPFVDKLRAGYDLVMGNRFMGGIEKKAMPFLNRYLGNPVLSFIGRLFFRSNIGDFHCGLRGFARQAVLNLGLRGDGMEFASEMVVKATMANLKIAEVPTKLYPDGRDRKPHLRPWRDGWRHLRLLLLFSPKWLFYFPGMFFFLAGLLLMSVLMLGPVMLFNAKLDIHTMLLSGLFMLIGMQLLAFFVFARKVAAKYLNLPMETSLLTRVLHLESGLVVGGLLCLIGIAGDTYAFWYWSAQSFGNLIPSQTMRIVIPASMSIMLGVQIIFASFFMSLLTLHLAD